MTDLAPSPEQQGDDQLYEDVRESLRQAEAGERPIPREELRIAPPPSEEAEALGKPWSFEVCQSCGRKNIASYRVTDSMWQRVTGQDEGVFCIWCFDEMALAKGIDWTEEPVNWYPVSSVANALWGEIESSPPMRPSERETLEEERDRLRGLLRSMHAAGEVDGRNALIARAEAAEARVAKLREAIRYRQSWIHDSAHGIFHIDDWVQCEHQRCAETRVLLAISPTEAAETVQDGGETQ